MKTGPAAVMGSLYDEDRAEHESKLAIYRLIYALTLVYCQEVCKVTERMRWQILTVEMTFLRRVAALSLRAKVSSSIIQKRLRFDQLLTLRGGS